MVGIVVGKLDEIEVARAIGSLPPNVNFAINASIARIFLDAEGVEYHTAASTGPLSAADVAALARRHTVLVECWE